MPKVAREFSDLDLDLTPHPVSGDLIPLRDADAVKRSVRNLIFTNVYERPFQPKLGSGLRQLLFEQINPLTRKSIEEAVKQVIRQHEKRATLIDVVAQVNADENGYNCTITFSIDNLSEVVEVDIFLERIR